jgi:L-lactate dehydrogenase complex protein LldF
VSSTLHSFEQAATRAAHDRPQQETVRTSLGTYNRALNAGRERFASWSEARHRARAVKADAVAHLGEYLEQFEARITSRGGHVFWAETAAAARDYILDLARRRGVRSVIKSKSMVSEEVHLGAALEGAGLEAVESDLGEFIVQLRNEPPYHIVTPAMHLRRAQIAALFQQKLGTPAGADSAEDLTMAARHYMRARFASAGMGITGANFLIADAGMVAITENEGNARLTASLPRVHVVLTGIEKILPRLTDLALFWPLLSTAGTGQAITCYSSLIGGPRQPGEADGPEEFHVVLLDNGRTRVLADQERRDTLQCIRCGACLNVCPVFHTIGGHAYGTTYSGPIGAVLTPLLRGEKEFGHLSFASSLCGACTEICPVEIDLHHHLIENRRDSALQHVRPLPERIGMRAFRWLMSDAARYARLAQLARHLLRFKNAWVPEGSPLDLLRPWTASRDLPEPPRESFREWWQRTRQERGGHA